MKTNDIPIKASENGTIFDSYVKAKSVLGKHENVVCSISGGSDSDIVLDICARLDTDKKIKYVFFDTGLEYKATKDHIKYLQEKYGITINREKAVKSVPTSCMEYGQPFHSKYTSEQLCRLQRHNFQWGDEPYDELVKKYPNCISSLKWWCSWYEPAKKIGYSKFNISSNKWLKEFLMKDPPTFKVSKKCCNYAKKLTGRNAEKGADLSITGIRKYEGGIRGSHYTACFSSNADIDRYRPVFWYRSADKKEYNRLFNIRNSDCYEVWGLDRTGCTGCPFNKYLENELSVIQQYEPQLYKACNNVFKDSYEYTRKYHEFRDDMKEREKYKTIK